MPHPVFVFHVINPTPYIALRGRKPFRACISLGRQNCVEAYSKLSEALHEGGIDGFLLETMNYWDEALIALEGLELFLRKVMIEIKYFIKFNIS